MTDFFLEIVNMSFNASFLIVAAIVLRAILAKAPKWIRGILWAMVGIRLILPFSLESSLSQLPTMSSKYMEGGGEVPLVTETHAQGITVFEDNSAMEIGEHAIESLQSGGISLSIIFATLWLLGMAAMLLYCGISYIRLRKNVADAVICCDGKYPIFQSEKVASPFVLGLITPGIYLPFDMESTDMDCVIAHERAHIARRDHWTKPLGFVILAVHWFNPLVWISYILLCRDIELACDEKVIRGMDGKVRKQYMDALLKCSVQGKLVSACPLAFGEVGVKKRIMNILHYKKPGFWIVVISVLLCAVVAVFFMTNPKEETILDAQASSQGNGTDAGAESVELDPNSPEEEFASEMQVWQEPPVLILRHPFSSSLNGFEVNSGTYQWCYEEGTSGMMTGVSASGAYPTVAVKGQEWIPIQEYSGEEYASYPLGFAVMPDDVSVREYDSLELGNTEADVLAEYPLEGTYMLELRPQRIYELIATWEVGSQNAFNGEATYIFATCAYTVSSTDNEGSLAGMNQPAVVDTAWDKDVNVLEGVKLLMEKYTNLGGNLEIVNQFGRELQGGEWFTIQREIEGRWYDLVSNDVVFNEVAYILRDGETTILPMTWEWMYGELPAGEYRVVTKIHDYRAPGDFDEYYLAEEFTIK